MLVALLPAVAALALRLAGAAHWTSLGVTDGRAAGHGARRGRSPSCAPRPCARPCCTAEAGPIDVYGHVELVEPRATKGQRLTIRVTAMEKHEAHAWPARVRIPHGGGEQRRSSPAMPCASRRRLSPAAGAVAAGRLRFRPRRPGSRGWAPWASPLAAAEIDANLGEPPLSLRLGAAVARVRQAIGQRVARGAARRDGRHCQCAHHRRARRHLGGDQPGLPRLRPVPHPLHLRPAHGDHGGRRVRLDPPAAGGDPGDRAALPDQEVGRSRAPWPARWATC